MVIVISVCKIIGIIVLVLAALLAAVLFLPVSYELDADIENRRCDIRVSWFLRLFRFRFSYAEKTELTISFLFFRFDFLDEEKRKKRKEKKAQKEAKKKKKKKKKRETKEEEASGKGPLQKAVGIVKSVTRVLGQFLEYDILDAIWPGLQIFLFRVRPRQVRGRLEFGFADPATTGQVTGGLSVIPLFYQTDLQIVPDFETEQTYISGTIYAKGHMLLFHALMLLIRWIRQENFRRFLKGIRSRS